MSRPEVRRALLIGNATYSDPKFTDLPCVRTDVEQVGRVLSARGIGGFQHVRPLLDQTADEMRVAIAEFLGEVGSDELAVLYVSGHGYRLTESTGEFYFIASDTDRSRIAETGVSASFVNDELVNCRAPQKVVLLDCCLSGGFAVGFQTRSAKSAAPSVTAAPLNSRGVYVLSSSGPGEASYGGAMGPTGPTMSVFTAEVVDALDSGQADQDGDGKVGVDELFNHVNVKLRTREKETRQTPVKSAVGVDDLIVLADTRSGSTSTLARTAAADPTDEVVKKTKSRSGMAALIDYYRSCVLADGNDAPLFPVNATPSEYVCLTGSERLLSGDVDESGSIPVPPEAVELVAGAMEANSELLSGYPAVVFLTGPDGQPIRSPRFAPLLIRRVAIVETDSGLRLEPYGPVLPHPQLAKDQLTTEDAEELLATYQLTWHAGQHARMAADARNLLATEFELQCVQELRPEALESRIDTNTALNGARNTAVLFRAPQDGAMTNLIKDLDYLLEHPDQIKGTALEALLNPAAPVTAKPVRLVTPWQTNEAQRAVLEAAMTQRLTVTTGPPGTGKSQLVANLVATAVANGETVLVGSTNNRAVDEVWERTELQVPGMLIRTGNLDSKAKEASSLQALAQLAQPTRTVATFAAECAGAFDVQNQVQQNLAQKARCEQELLSLGRARDQLSTELGHSAASLTAMLESGLVAWPVRARRAAAARLFGTWRRARVLRRLGMDGDPTAERCALIARYADAELAWRKNLSALSPLPGDSILTAEMERAQRQVTHASRALVDATVRESAYRGRAALQTLAQTRQSGGSDWGKVKALLLYVRGWAVTTLSARRFPTQKALFDLVIIDEASQCSIPSVLPLLFRARRVLIIGDAMQLGHITQLKPGHEAKIAKRYDLEADWLEERRLSYCRDSAFHAAERAYGRPSLLLDEHYRCHPEIAEVSNRLFYNGALTVLTDVRALQRTERPPLLWKNVDGQAVRPPFGGSWVNAAEADYVNQCVEYLLKYLPAAGTIGVVTPFAAQQKRIEKHWASREPERVKVGTAHTFQGGERDAMIFSLVAAEGMNPGAMSWLEDQANLWNVAITRAKSHLVMLGNDAHWLRRGGLGGKLKTFAESGVMSNSEGAPATEIQRLYRVLSSVPGNTVELSLVLDGYTADAVVTAETGSTAVLLDLGHHSNDPAKHLRVQLIRIQRLGNPDSARESLRLAAWKLYDIRREPTDLLG